MGLLQRRRRRCHAALVASVAGLIVLAGAGKHCRAAAPADRLLPRETVLYLSIHDYGQCKARFNETGMGRLLADPALEGFMGDVNAALAELSGQVEAQIGMSVTDLLALPQGEVSVALTFGQQRWGVVAFVDVGDNEAKVQELLDIGSKTLEAAGSKRREEQVEATTVILFDPPAEELNPVQLAYFFRDGRLGLLLGTPGEMGKLAADLLGRWKGDAADTLADHAAYQDIVQRCAPNDGGRPQVTWFIDPMGFLTHVGQLFPQAGLDLFLAFLPQLGLNQLKGLGGTFDMAAGPYDTISRTFIAVEPPIGGALNLLSWPNANVSPETWVPSDVASYTTLNWDLKLLWQTLGTLADQFGQPGQFGAQMQQAGQNLGIDIQQDLIDPLGSRLTVLEDFEEPISPTSARTLLGVALADPQRFAQTLDKLIAKVGAAQVKRREFQGHLIYEMQLPAGMGMMPFGGVPGGGLGQPAGEPQTVGVTVAHDYLLVADKVGLLDKVLREGGDRLVDSLDYQLVAERFPEQTNLLTFSRPEVSWRSWYEPLRSGKLQQQMGMLMMMLPQAVQQIDGSKLPPFEQISRYFAPAGGYGTVQEGGTLFVSYWLRKESP